MNELNSNSFNMLASNFILFLENKVGFNINTVNAYKRDLFKRFYMVLRNYDYDLNKAFDNYRKEVIESTFHPKTKVSKVTHIRRFISYINEEDFSIRVSTSSHIHLQVYHKLLEEFLSNFKNNKESTIEKKRMCLEKFLCYLEEQKVFNSFNINMELILNYLKQQVDPYHHQIVKNFLLFLYNSNKIKYNLGLFIEAPKRIIKMPSTYTVDEINLMESHIDTSSKTGLRNYCIFLLASELGIRIGDICKLKYDDLDFTNKKISFVQTKTSVFLELPLSDKIVNTITKYISLYKDERIEYIFTATNMPLRVVSAEAFGSWLSELMQKSNIDTNGKKHGPHSLRSSLVTNMIGDGVPYEVVRKVVGHTSEEAITHYAKIDINKLATYSLDPIELGPGITAVLTGGRNV